MTLVSGDKYEGTVPLGGAMAGQPFTFTIEAGRLDFQNTGEAQPIICDGFAVSDAAGGNAGTGGNSLGAGDEGLGGGAIAAIVICILLAVGAGLMFKFKFKGEPPPPPHEVGVFGTAPLPPGEHARVLITRTPAMP